MAPRISLRSSTGLFILLSLLTGLRAQAPIANQAQAPQVNIGVVDVNKVLDNYPKAIEGKKRLTALGKDIDERLMAETEQIKNLRLAQESYQRGSRDWQVKELEIAQALNLRDGHKQIWQADLNEQANRFLVQACDEVEVAVGQVAKTRNVQIVLRKDAFESRTLESKVSLYERRVVWFASDAVDLTPAVIQQLQVAVPAVPTVGDNAATKGGAGAAPPGPTVPGRSGGDKK